MLSDAQLIRYSRQILVNEFDVAGQERLLASRVLIVGLGGLGCPAALYLAAAGVGELGLADGDAVELSNLQRQIAHTQADMGGNKASSVAQSIAAIDSGIAVTVIERHLAETDMQEFVTGVDLVLDCTDNYATRFALNRVCIREGVPLLSAAAVRTEGQVALFDPTNGGPCYRCLYQESDVDTALSCSESGVLAPLVGVIGSLQAMEAVKFLSGYGMSLRGRLLLLDMYSTQIRELSLPRKPDCPACGHLPV